MYSSSVCYNNFIEQSNWKPENQRNSTRLVIPGQHASNFEIQLSEYENRDIHETNKIEASSIAIKKKQE